MKQESKENELKFREMEESQLLNIISNSKADQEVKRALEELLLRNYDWLRSYCLSKISNEALANDCLQEIMIAIAKGVKKFRADSAFGTWAYIIAQRTVGSFLRKNKLEQKRLEQIDKQEFEDNKNPNLVEGMQIAEESQRILNAVRNLPAQQQDAVIFYYFEDLPFEDVALRMNCSTGSLKSHLFRAREKLRKELANLFYEK
jgi:RNA polymerase sigma-70 factor, ECF subfamily